VRSGRREWGESRRRGSHSSPLAPLSGVLSVLTRFGVIVWVYANQAGGKGKRERGGEGFCRQKAGCGWISPAWRRDHSCSSSRSHFSLLACGAAMRALMEEGRARRKAREEEEARERAAKGLPRLRTLSPLPLLPSWRAHAAGVEGEGRGRRERHSGHLPRDGRSYRAFGPVYSSHARKGYIKGKKSRAEPTVRRWRGTSWNASTPGRALPCSHQERVHIC